VPLWGKILVGIFLVLVGGVLVYLLVEVWPAVLAATGAANPRPTTTAHAKTISVFGAAYSPDPDVTLLLLVAVLSALGSYVHAAQSFVDFAGNRRLVVSWTWWYIFRILIGVALAEIFYFAIRAGFFGTDTPTTDINPYGIAAIAGLVGLFSKQATDKLREVFETLFKTAPGYGDDTRKDSLTNPSPVVRMGEPAELSVGSTLLQIELVGEGFIHDSVARVSRPLEGGIPVPRDTAYVSASRLRVTLTPEDVAEAGSVSITVFNPAPGGGISEPVLLLVT
jgi:hypothetical protein